MPSPKHKTGKSKKVQKKLNKLIDSSSEDEETLHELSYYANDRVKLMKEVLKIIKPRKIKAMAPDCIKDLDGEEINSMLLEELLGISNKRLKYIFNGQNLEEDSSSTDVEDEVQPIDIISLDDVSDDEFVVEAEAKKKIKKEHKDKSKKDKSEKLQEEKLMSVLELLELQARARAIRSQLMLEGSKKPQRESESKPDDTEEIIDDDDDAIIIETPTNDEIIITSTDSEHDNDTTMNEEAIPGSSNSTTPSTSHFRAIPTKKRKIKLIRDRLIVAKTAESGSQNETDSPLPSDGNLQENQKEDNINCENISDDQTNCTKTSSTGENHVDNDEIVINVDHDEMAGIIEGETQ